MIRKDTDPIHWVLFFVGTVVLFAFAVVVALVLMWLLIQLHLHSQLAMLLSIGASTLGFLFLEFWLITDLFYKEE